MKQHSVRRLLSLVICIFMLASLFSVCALAENELETVELEIPNPAPEFPTLWVQAVAPDNSVVSNLLLELVLPGGEVAASLVTDDSGIAAFDLSGTADYTSASLQRSAADSSDYGPAAPVAVVMDCGSLVSVADQASTGFSRENPYMISVYPDRYGISADSGIVNGTVNLPSSAAAVHESVTVTAVPAEYYEFESLQVTLGGTVFASTTDSPSLSFEMPAGDVTVFAAFRPILFPVSVSGTEHGSVLADKSSAAMGETVTLTVMPDSGYMTESLSVTAADGSGVELLPGGTFVMPAGNVTITAAFKEAKPVFTTHSLILGGELGLNFFMDLPTFEGADYSESYMSFTVNDKTQQDVFDPDDTDLGGNGYYGFTCNLNALQMADEITADFHYRVNGEEQTVSQIYTAEAYLNALVSNDEISDEVKALARSLLDYGYYSQAFLSGIENRTVDADHVRMTTHFTESYSGEQIADILDELADQTFLRDRNRNIRTASCSLVLDSATSIYLYLDPAEDYSGEISAVVDGAPVPVSSEADGRYLIVIPEISADQLGDTHRVVVTTAGADPMTVQVSALSYVKACLEDAASGSDMVDAMTALYYYYKAASELKQTG